MLMSINVLIVEDNEATRTALAVLLQSAGYTTAEAEDGQEALAYLRAHPVPRLILLDMMMPRMDGWEFLLQRHKESAPAAVPVVVFSAAVGIDGAALRALGAEEVLHKPADADALLAAVGRYC
jgi:CheY-like chemotaxis protein